MIGKLKFKKRVLAAFCFVLFLVAVFPLNVFAYRYNGVFSDRESALSYFGLNDTPMFNMIDSGQAFMQIHDNVNDYNQLSMFGLTSSNESDYQGYFDEVKQYSSFNVYKTFNPDSSDNPNEAIALSSSTYHLLTVFNNGSGTYAYMYYFWTEDNKPVYVVAGPQGNYIASEGTLHCWGNEISSSENDGVARNYDSYVIVNNDGVNYVSYGQSIRDYFVFTDMSVYNATDSGNSGFTNSGFSGGTADFDFDDVSSYYDFNLPKTSGDFIDPNAPDEPEVQDTLARYYLKFNDTTFYGGQSLTNFYHHNDFTFNEYQLQHPEQFKINFVYQIELNRFNSANLTWGFPSFYNYSTSVNLAYMLGQNKRFGTGSHVAIPLSVNHFVDDSGNTNLADVLKTCVTNIDGTNSSVANPNTIIGSVESEIDTLHEVLWGPDTVTSKQLNPVISRYYNSNTNYAIKDFYIKGTVSIVDINDSNYESGTYRDYYNFRDGKGGVLSSSSTDEPYQLPEALNPAPLSNNGSGDVSTNNGTVVNNYISGGARGGAELVKVWTPFTLSEVSYANTHGMFQDILDFMDAESENGFLPVVKQVFSFLPDTIWTYLTISIACICGFAVIRYVLRR